MSRAEDAADIADAADTADAEKRFTAEAVANCPRCTPLLVWGTASGPRALQRRLLLLCELVDAGRFEEIAIDQYGRHEPWSAHRELITEDVIINGAGPTVDLDSSMTVRCLEPKCYRTYRQGWTFERGAESWTITVRNASSR